MHRPTLATTAAVLLINAPIYLGYQQMLAARQVAVEAAGMSADQVVPIFDEWLGTFCGAMLLLVCMPSLFALFGSKIARGWLMLLMVLGAVLVIPFALLDPMTLISPQTLLPLSGIALLYAPASSKRGADQLDTALG